MTTMTISLREARMVLERLTLVTGVNPGLVPMLRDCALYSAWLGLGGFEQVEANMTALERARPTDLELVDEDGRIELRGHGLHAWYAVGPLADMLAEAVRNGRPAEIVVTGCAHVAELRAVEAVGRRLDLSVSVVIEANGVRVSAEPAPSDAPDPLAAIIRDGLPVETELWWRLFDQSDRALSPDSFESRRHAGAIIVEADGRVIGRQDEDDTDLSMLANAEAAAAARARLDKGEPA